MKYQQEGARLREARTAKGVTLDDAGRHVGLSGPAVRHWETGRSKPDVDVARALDQLYGTGGEIVGLYGYAPEPGTVTLAELDAKLSVLRDGQVEVMGHVGSEIARATEQVTAALERLSDQVERMRRAQVRGDRSGRAGVPRR